MPDKQSMWNLIQPKHKHCFVIVRHLLMILGCTVPFISVVTSRKDL